MTLAYLMAAAALLIAIYAAWKAWMAEGVADYYYKLWKHSEARLRAYEKLHGTFPENLF